MNDPEQPSDPRLPLTNNAAKSSFAASSPARVTPSNKKTARPRTWKTYAKWTALSVFAVGATAAGFIVNRFSHNDYFNKIARSIITDPGNVIKKRDLLANFDYTQILPPEKQHSINILILGCDHDYDDRTQQPILTTPGRSDSIMMAHLDFDAKTVKCLTIPRDTAVQIPGHRGLHKINAAHEFGDNDLTVQTIKERFGLDTDYYVTLDFESFQKVVNAIGGVEVMIHKPLNYDDNWGNLHVHLKPGYQKLDGYRAMGYVRIRHSDSDIMRAERQHEFIEALRTKITNPTNFMKLPGVMDAVTNDLHFSPTLNHDALLSIVKWVKDLPKESITLDTLPNFEGRSYCYIYQDKARKVLADMFYNGMEGMVQMDVPTWDQVASLNSGGVHLNSAGESVGGDGEAIGRRRRGRTVRRHTASLDATTPRDDSGNALGDSGKEGETASTDDPMPMPEETTADGHRSRRTRRHSGQAATTGDAGDSKDAGGSAGTDAKDGNGGSDTGTNKGDGNAKGGADKPKDSGSKGDSGTDKPKDGGSGDKTDPKTGDGGTL